MARRKQHSKRKVLHVGGKDPSSPVSAGSSKSCPGSVSPGTIKANNTRILREVLVDCNGEGRQEPGEEGESLSVVGDSQEDSGKHGQTKDTVVISSANQTVSGIRAEGLIPEPMANQMKELEGQNEGIQLEKGKAGVLVSGTKQRLTFREALAGNRANVGGRRLKYREGFEDGIIRFTKQDVEKNTCKWKQSLIGMVIGSRVPHQFMQNFVSSRWTEIQPPKVILTDSEVFVFKFQSAEDMEWVLNNGPWMVGGTRPLVLRRWSEGVKLDKTCFETAQVWLQLPKLDVRFWDEDFF